MNPDRRPPQRLVFAWVNFFGFGVWIEKKIEVLGITLPFFSIEYYWGRYPGWDK